MSRFFIIVMVVIVCGCCFGKLPQLSKDYKIVWSDEFNVDGAPDPNNWIYENGFVRNNELQWYQPDNASCKGGMLIIEAKREPVKNPNYSAKGRSWKTRRKYAEYSSSCIKTRGKHSWLYGRFQIRAKIDIRDGIWPAFWTLGSARGWPGCGEIDIMEYYRKMMLANACWYSNKRPYTVWDDARIPIKEFTGPDPKWSDKFHLWTMDWDSDTIKLYVGDRLLNTIELGKTFNDNKSKDDKSEKANPFREPHYILLNMAIGGANGGDPSKTKFPAIFAVDYVRVWQKQKLNHE